MRTYSGHSSARASNELYRMNLSKGQTGLSVAFHLPTLYGYDSDHPMSKGEVGKLLVSLALAQRPELLVLDEPFTALDVAAVQMLQDVIRRHVAADGIAIITTHQEVAMLGDQTRTIVLGRHHA